MSKYKKIFIGLIFGLILFSILSNSRAIYSENIVIDGNLDADYNLISDSDNFTVYYANSEDYNFFFINFAFNISGQVLMISSGSFNYDISAPEVQTNFLHSLIKNNILEIQLKRDVLGDEIKFEIKNLGILILVINPNSKPIAEDEEDDTKDDKDSSDSEESLLTGIDKRLSEVTFVDGILFGILIASFIFSIAIISWRLKIYPIMVFLDGDSKNYKSIKGGRFMKQERAEEGLKGYWKFYLKNGDKGIIQVYSDEPLEEIREKTFRKVNIIQEEYPLYSLKTVQLEEEDYFKRKEMNMSKKNKAKYYLLRFACRCIPNNKIAMKIYESIEMLETEELISEVQILQFTKTMKKIRHTCTVKYDQWIADEKEGRILKKDIIKKKLALHLVEDLKIDPSIERKSIKIKNIKTSVIRFHDVKEAIENDADAEELRTIHTYEMKRAERRYRALIEKYNILRETLRQKNIELEEKVIDVFQNAHYENNNSKIDFLQKVLGKTTDGLEIREAIKEAEIEIKTAEKTKEIQDLERELIRFSTIIEQQKETIDFLKMNVGINNSNYNPLPTIKIKDNLDEGNGKNRS